MSSRLEELYRILKKTGSFYLHCDFTSNHYLKTICDIIFKSNNFINEIIWKNGSFPIRLKRKYRRQHDTILFYTKSKKYTFNPQYLPLKQKSLKKYKKDSNGIYCLIPLIRSDGFKKSENNEKYKMNWRGYDPANYGKNGGKWIKTIDGLEQLFEKNLVIFYEDKKIVPKFKYYLKEEAHGVNISTIWDDIFSVNPHSKKEILEYSTQKPEKLLKRIIEISSNKGDIVLDCFCGSGTTLKVANDLERKWIGIDISKKAVDIANNRIANNRIDDTKQLTINTFLK